MSGRKANDKRRILALAESILDNPPEELRDLIRVNGPVPNVARAPDAELTGVIARIEITPASNDAEGADPAEESGEAECVDVGVIGEVLFTNANGVTSARKARVLYSGVGVYVADLHGAVEGPIWMRVKDGKLAHHLLLTRRADELGWEVPSLGEISPVELRNRIRRSQITFTQIPDPVELDRIRDPSIQA